MGYWPPERAAALIEICIKIKSAYSYPQEVLPQCEAPVSRQTPLPVTLSRPLWVCTMAAALPEMAGSAPGHCRPPDLLLNCPRRLVHNVPHCRGHLPLFADGVSHTE